MPCRLPSPPRPDARPAREHTMKSTMKSFPKLIGALACCLSAWVASPARADDDAMLRAAVATERARAVAPRQPRDAFVSARALQEIGRASCRERGEVGAGAEG